MKRPETWRYSFFWNVYWTRVNQEHYTICLVNLVQKDLRRKCDKSLEEVSRVSCVINVELNFSFILCHCVFYPRIVLNWKLTEYLQCLKWSNVLSQDVKEFFCVKNQNFIEFKNINFIIHSKHRLNKASNFYKNYFSIHPFSYNKLWTNICWLGWT